MDNRQPSLQLLATDRASEDSGSVRNSVSGFPSPAEDHMEPSIDLNRILIRDSAATFFARATGGEMKEYCIREGDLLVIDKSVEPYDGCVAVCFFEGEFILRRLKIEHGKISLYAADGRNSEIKADADFTVWGVVTYTIHKI